MIFSIISCGSYVCFKFLYYFQCIIFHGFGIFLMCICHYAEIFLVYVRISGIFIIFFGLLRLEDLVCMFVSS